MIGGCGFFSYFDAPNKNDKFCSMARRITLLEGNNIRLQRKVEELELKMDDMEMRRALVFGHHFYVVLKLVFIVIVVWLLLNWFVDDSAIVL